MTRQRSVRLAGVVAVTLLLTAAPAIANQPQLLLADLEDYLAEAEQADYAGTQVVVTLFGDETKAGVVNVAHAGGVVLSGEGTLAGDGKVRTLGTGVVVSSSNQVSASARYTTSDPVDLRYLGRKAKSVSIMEGNLLRANIIFDKKTGAPLSSQVYDADGAIFRQAFMLNFDPTPPRDVYEVSGETGSEYTVLLPAPREDAPGQLAGYQLGDRYSGPDEVYHSFYSDGLFSFSLFEMEGNPRLEQFSDSITTEFDRSKYEVLVTPTQLWVRWSRPGTTYVLVGDLPPDHLEDVLSELPRPRKRNVFERFWRGLFG